MVTRITNEKISAVISRALSSGIISNDDTVTIFYDLSFLYERINNLKRSFPEDTLHAIAVKANPLTKILSHIKELNGGSEAASLPELYLAEKTGFKPSKIVFDSPVKTESEIKYAMKLGAHINADSLTELEIIDRLMKDIPTNSSFGIRINPQVGTGNIAITSVGGEYSKFGVPIKEYRKELADVYLKYDWLNGVHVHIGSQGCPSELLIKGIETVYNFVVEINNKLLAADKKLISIFDIGGGLPVSYSQNQNPITIEEYSAELKKKLPGLFTNDFKLITEFGRYIFANSGWTISRVENVKQSGNIKTAMIHVGADLFIRRAYMPEEWHHDISVADKFGNIKSGKDIGKYVIAGPLCFSGDIIAKNIELPKVEKDDFIIVHDTGAYTLSMWSRYNSRQIPKVVGYYNNGERFEILKERETLEDLYKFWS